MILLCFVGGGGCILLLDRSTFHVGIRSKLYRISSVRGTSMSENHDTKVCRHTKNHVAKIGLSGRKWATFSLVADMSPTCRRHYQPSSPLSSCLQKQEIVHNDPAKCWRCCHPKARSVCQPHGSLIFNGLLPLAMMANSIFLWG